MQITFASDSRLTIHSRKVLNLIDMGNGNTKAGTIRRLVQARKTFREALNLWPEDRMNREHWREVMRDAPSVVYGRKRTLMESKDDELMEEFHKLLEGQTPQETRAVLTTKEIALFLSSTFTDMKTERDLLMEDVYPYLREFCRRLGYEFSVADMRWGVRDQMTDEHQAVQICVTEVQRCRRVRSINYQSSFLITQQRLH